MKAATLTVFGPRASGKTHLANRLRAVRLEVVEPGNCYDCLDRHLYLIPAGKQKLYEALEGIGYSYNATKLGAVVMLLPREAPNART
jgi:hypothetical protein